MSKRAVQTQKESAILSPEQLEERIKSLSTIHGNLVREADFRLHELGQAGGYMPGFADEIRAYADLDFDTVPHRHADKLVAKIELLQKSLREMAQEKQQIVEKKQLSDSRQQVEGNLHCLREGLLPLLKMLTVGQGAVDDLPSCVSNLERRFLESSLTSRFSLEGFCIEAAGLISSCKMALQFEMKVLVRRLQEKVLKCPMNNSNATLQSWRHEAAPCIKSALELSQSEHAQDFLSRFSDIQKKMLELEQRFPLNATAVQGVSFFSGVTVPSSSHLVRQSLGLGF